MYKSITIEGIICDEGDFYSAKHKKALETINKEIREAAGGKIINIITTKVPLEASAGYNVTSVITYVIGFNIQP
ncbi:MAG: hypothetical protein J6D03_04550 [Clostridia bacterium]|nr:hypothetical protein [Clostridia bacterium]